MNTKKTFEELALYEAPPNCVRHTAIDKNGLVYEMKTFDLKSFLTSALAEQKEGFRKEVENTRREIICAACDGAKCGHTLSCKLRNKILEILK